MSSKGCVPWNWRDLSGQVFGSWKIVRYEGNSYWLCRCVCGHERPVLNTNLFKGVSTSCGIGKCARTFVHGHSPTKGKVSSEYQAWRNMRARCYQPSMRQFRDYGGRGIKVCPQWLNSFTQFFKDMGPKPTAKHTLEREDVNGDYGPDNCKWATWKEQAWNKRVRRGRYSTK
jgi:hypothetical protein